MRTQIEKIKRDISIHKEVEKELAKRSHFCQKVIKKLKGNVEVLENHKSSMPALAMNNENKSVNAYGLPKSNPDEEMINFLENKLENIER